MLSELVFLVNTSSTIEHCVAAYYFGYANNMAVRASVFEELGLFKEWERAAASELVQRLALKRQRLDLWLGYWCSMRVTHNAAFAENRFLEISNLNIWVFSIYTLAA